MNNSWQVIHLSMNDLRMIRAQLAAAVEIIESKIGTVRVKDLDISNGGDVQALAQEISALAARCAYYLW